MKIVIRFTNKHGVRVAQEYGDSDTAMRRVDELIVLGTYFVMVYNP